MNRKTFLKLAAAVPFIPLLSIGKEAGRVEVFKDMVLNWQSLLYSNNNDHLNFGPAASCDLERRLEILVFNDTSDLHFTRYHIVKDPGVYILRSRNIVKVKKVTVKNQRFQYSFPGKIVNFLRCGVSDITIHHY